VSSLFIVAVQLALVPLALGSADAGGGSQEGSSVLAASSGEIRLGDEPATVRVPAVAKSSGRLNAAPEAGHGSLWLQLEGLRLLRPGAFYQVYLNLPAGQTPDPKGLHFAGNLSLYGAQPGGAAELEHSLNVTDAVRQLAKLGLWKGELAVTLVRGGRSEAVQADHRGDFMVLRRIALVER
jgi:hypothetical protein